MPAISVRPSTSWVLKNAPERSNPSSSTAIWSPRSRYRRESVLGGNTFSVSSWSRPAFTSITSPCTRSWPGSVQGTSWASSWACSGGVPGSQGLARAPYGERTPATNSPSVRANSSGAANLPCAGILVIIWLVFEAAGVGQAGRVRMRPLALDCPRAGRHETGGHFPAWHLSGTGPASAPASMLGMSRGLCDLQLPDVLGSSLGFVMVPAGPEHQPVVLDEPEVLVIDLARGRVHVLVRHPGALLGGREGPVA